MKKNGNSLYTKGELAVLACSTEGNARSNFSIVLREGDRDGSLLGWRKVSHLSSLAEAITLGRRTIQEEIG